MIDLGGGVVSVRLALPFSAPLRLSVGSELVTVTIAGTLVLAGTTVPEPSAALLLGIAGALAWREREKWRAAR